MAVGSWPGLYPQQRPGQADVVSWDGFTQCRRPAGRTFTAGVGDYRLSGHSSAV